MKNLKQKFGTFNFGPQDSSNEFSGLQLRNVNVNGRRTSVRLEIGMWEALYEVAAIEEVSLGDLYGAIFDMKGPKSSFTSAIRCFLLMYYRQTFYPAQSRKQSLVRNQGIKDENKRGATD